MKKDLAKITLIVVGIAVMAYLSLKILILIQ